MRLQLALLVLFVAQGTASTTPLSTYVGKWSNVEPRTRGYESLQIDLKNGVPVVTIPPHRQPFEGVPYADTVSDPVTTHTAAIVINASRRLFVIRLARPDRLRMEVFTVFDDSRSNYVHVDEFARSK